MTILESMFYSFTSPVQWQPQLRDRCSLVEEADWRVISHHRISINIMIDHIQGLFAECPLDTAPLLYTFAKHHLHLLFSLFVTLSYSSTIHTSIKLENRNQTRCEARPGWPGAGEDGVGNVPLFPLDLPLLALKLVLVVACCSIVHM